MLAQASETARHLQVEVDQVITPTSQESRNKLRYFLHGMGLGLACLCLLGASIAVLQASHDKSSAADQAGGVAFAPVGLRGNSQRTGRAVGPMMMSHFTTVATEIKDEPLLQKTLIEMGLEVKVATEVPQHLNMELVEDQQFWQNEMTVVSLDGSTVVADIIANQESKLGKPAQGIAFKQHADGKFQLLTDTDGWKQSVPLEVWMDKLNQKYAINVVKDSAHNVGFDVESTKVTNEGVVELVMNATRSLRERGSCSWL